MLTAVLKYISSNKTVTVLLTFQFSTKFHFLTERSEGNEMSASILLF